MEEVEFNRIANKYIDVIYRSVLVYCKNKSDADDAVQNAFYKLLITDTEFKDDDHIRKWLIKVAINECKSIWRSFWYKNVTSFEELETEPEYIDPEKNEVFSEVMKLPRKYSIVLHLYYYEGYGCREIAAVLGISESNVQTRLMRGRNILKEKLKEAWL